MNANKQKNLLKNEKKLQINEDDKGRKKNLREISNFVLMLIRRTVKIAKISQQLIILR